jgi:carbamoyl-phosphate synthase small subunit
MAGTDLAREVTAGHSYHWTSRDVDLTGNQAEHDSPDAGPQLHVVAYDFGIKRGILRQLAGAGCRVTVVPADTEAEAVLVLKPDGVLLSNGPGDPEPVEYAAANVKKLIGKVPIFGICLGHQILALASGAKSFKLKFGHRGANHPV